MVRNRVSKCFTLTGITSVRNVSHTTCEVSYPMSWWFGLHVDAVSGRCWNNTRSIDRCDHIYILAPPLYQLRPHHHLMSRPQLQHGLLMFINELSNLLLVFIHECRHITLTLLGHVGDDVVYFCTTLILGLQHTPHVY